MSTAPGLCGLNEWSEKVSVARSCLEIGVKVSQTYLGLTKHNPLICAVQIDTIIPSMETLEYE